MIKAFRSPYGRYHVLNASGILAYNVTYQAAFDALAEAGHDDPAAVLANPISPDEYRSLYASAVVSELESLANQVAALPASEAVEAINATLLETQRNVATLRDELRQSNNVTLLRSLESDLADQLSKSMAVARQHHSNPQELLWIEAEFRRRLEASELGQRIAEIRRSL